MLRWGYPATWLFVSLLFVIWIWLTCLLQTRVLSKYFEYLIMYYCSAITTSSREISVFKIVFTCSMSSQGTGGTGCLTCYDSQAQQHQCNVTVIKLLIGRAVTTDNPSRDLTVLCAINYGTGSSQGIYGLMHRLILLEMNWVEMAWHTATKEMALDQREQGMKICFFSKTISSVLLEHNQSAMWQHWELLLIQRYIIVWNEIKRRNEYTLLY